MTLFKFEPFSRKQRMIFNWWTETSPVRDWDGIIADGAIRSGKTLCMSLSFVMWAMSTFNGANFGMCGKTIGSFHRNVLSVLAKTLPGRGYRFEYRRGDKLLIITRGNVTNNFYIFGGKDEASQDLVQGITLSGVFFDEVALMPESFVNQATARCSVDGSKMWFNCNPSSAQHWFKIKWIDKQEKRRLCYLHFTMDDNLSLSEQIKERYRNQYTGAFYDRYIRGLWVAAEGVIYDMFDYEKHVTKLKDIAKYLTNTVYVSCDYGTQNPMVFKMWVKGTNNKWYCIREYYWNGREERKQKTDAQYVEDMRAFVGDTTPRAVIVDPSAASFITALKDAGFPVLKADNDVMDGIRWVSVCLKKQKIAYTDVCVDTIKEYGEYVWDDKALEKGVDQPLKINDHCMDADRYFLYTVLYKKHSAVKDKAKEGFR